MAAKASKDGQWPKTTRIPIPTIPGACGGQLESDATGTED